MYSVNSLLHIQGYSIDGERMEDVQKCRSKRNKEFVDFSKVTFIYNVKTIHKVVNLDQLKKQNDISKPNHPITGGQSPSNAHHVKQP